MTDPIAPDPPPHAPRAAPDAAPAEGPTPTSSARLPDPNGAAGGGCLGVVLGTVVYAALLFAVVNEDTHPFVFFLVAVGGGVLIPIVALKFAAIGAFPAETVKTPPSTPTPPAGPVGVGGQTSVAIPAHRGEDVVPPEVAMATTETVER